MNMSAINELAKRTALPQGRVTPEAGRRVLEEARSHTVWQAVNIAAASDPEKFALIAADDAGNIQRLTYRRLLDRVRNFSTGLASIGVRRGDRVVLWMTNTPEWIVCSLSCMRLGATPVPINPFLPVSEIGSLIAQSGARHLILIDRFRELNFARLLGDICPEFRVAVEPGHLCSAQFPDLRNVVLFARSAGVEPGAFDFSRLEDSGASMTGGGWQLVAQRMEQACLPTDLAMIKYTSGTSGPPKGVMLEQGGLVANGLLHSHRIGIGKDDIFFSMMPFFHGGGCIYGQMTMLPNGGTLVFTEAFNPSLAVKLIDQERATVEVGVLSKELVQAALEQGRLLGSLRIAHLPNEDARRVMPNVTFSFSAFGLTETYGPASMTAPDDPPELRSTTSGRPLEGYECRAIDPITGKDVAPDCPGEAWIRGNIMRGYWNQPEDTARAIDAEGWLHTEDLVTIDTKGYVTWLGRLKLTLEIGGELVPVEEVERTIERHDAVHYCAVASVPDSRAGEFLRIYATRQPRRELIESDLRHWLKERLPAFRLPFEIEIVDTLPRLPNGKLDRLTLAQWPRRKSPLA